MKKLSLILAASALLLPGLATAGSIQANSNVISNRDTDFANVPLTFAQFNPSLGTLDSVTFDFTGTIAGHIYLFSREEAQVRVQSFLQADMTFGSPIGNLLSFSSFVNTNELIDPGQTILHDGLTGNQSGSTNSLTNSTLLSFVQGGGTFDIPVSAHAVSGSDGSGNIDTDFSVNAGAYGTITYNYTDAQTPDAPEPASMVLMGSALVGLGLARRKFRS